MEMSSASDEKSLNQKGAIKPYGITILLYRFLLSLSHGNIQIS